MCHGISRPPPPTVGGCRRRLVELVRCRADEPGGLPGGRRRRMRARRGELHMPAQLIESGAGSSPVWRVASSLKGRPWTIGGWGGQVHPHVRADHDARPARLRHRLPRLPPRVTPLSQRHSALSQRDTRPYAVRPARHTAPVPLSSWPPSSSAGADPRPRPLTLDLPRRVPIEPRPAPSP